MDEYRKRTWIIVGSVVLAVALVLSAFVIGTCVGKKKEAAKHDPEKSKAWYVIFTDETTGKEYKVMHNDGVLDTVPYDGETHTFAWQKYTKYDKKLGEPGRLKVTNGLHDEGREACLPGHYSFVVEEWYSNTQCRRFSIGLQIKAPSKLQPEMRFDANGGEIVTEGEYYRYHYDGERHYPIAYGWYNGKRLDADPNRSTINGCKNAEGKSVIAPQEVGVYMVDFWIAHYKQDPNGEVYYSIRKTVTVEIIE